MEKMSMPKLEKNITAKEDSFYSVSELFQSDEANQELSSSKIEELKVEDNKELEKISLQIENLKPEDNKDIGKNHLQIDKEKIESSRNDNIKNPSPNLTEIVNINNHQYTVEYVPKEDIYPAYGYGGGDKAVVRQDLPPRVKKFVRSHELYHCQDKSDRGGWLGKELRANLIPGLKDPVGLAVTIWATVTDIDRIKFYLKRTREGC